MQSLKTKAAFITGAAHGIGRATAIRFAQSQIKVAVVDVAEADGLETVKLIEKNGGTAKFIKCDISKEEDVKRAIHETVQSLGSLSYAFNNAGVEGVLAKTDECTMESYNHMMDVNVKGTWLCMKYQLKEMLKQGGGAIVNCSSMAGTIGFPGLPVYAASKHAVIGLTKTAAIEYAPSNIRVNAVCPGVIQTRMIDRVIAGKESLRQMLVKGEPIGRFGKPEEVAEAVFWLCSPQASFVTGHPMAVDGGWVAQ